MICEIIDRMRLTQKNELHQFNQDLHIPFFGLASSKTNQPSAIVSLIKFVFFYMFLYRLLYNYLTLL